MNFANARHDVDAAELDDAAERLRACM
jgi:hypothetical protein